MVLAREIEKAGELASEASFIVPVGLWRCLPMITSAFPDENVAHVLSTSFTRRRQRVQCVAQPAIAAREERVKLTANALNTLSVAVAAAGFIKPIVEAVEVDLTRYTWLGAALVIHFVARWSLGALEE